MATKPEKEDTLAAAKDGGTDSTEETEKVSKGFGARDVDVKMTEKDKQELGRELRGAFEKVQQRIVRPNVLLAGASGSGKSELVNAVFGSGTAQTGIGAPVTQGYTGYGYETSSAGAVAIYDCKGLEHGASDEFVTTTKAFLEENRLDPAAPEKGIHCVWYVINLAEARIVDYTFELWNTVYKGQKIICVLNKADLVSEDVVEQMRMRVINEGGIPPERVVVTVANVRVRVRNQQKCPKCQGSRVRVDTEECELYCKNCCETFDVKVQHNLSGLVSATKNVLPEITRYAFISSQKVDLALKDEQGCAIIRRYIAENTTYNIKAFCAMMGEIGNLFRFEDTTAKVKDQVEKIMTVEGFEAFLYVLFDKISSFFTTTQNQVELCCFGVAAYQTYRFFKEQAVDTQDWEEMTAEESLTIDERLVRKKFNQVFDRAHHLCIHRGTDDCLREFFPTCMIEDSK